MRTVWYNLLAYPDTMRRLREELLEAQAVKPGGFSTPYPSWKDVCDLPYLDACINEGVRLHPPFCLPFERVVPKGGMMIGDTYFQEGTVVGMSPYVVNRHKPTFGEDADVWNPDRWIVPEVQKRKLEASVMTVSIIRAFAPSHRDGIVLTDSCCSYSLVQADVSVSAVTSPCWN